MKKKKRTGLKIVLAVLLVIFLALGVFAAANWTLVRGAFQLLKNAPGNNLKAAWIFLTSNSDGIERQISENDGQYSDAVQKVAEELGESGLNLSQYTLDILNSGDYSEEEIIQILLSGDNNPVPGSESVPETGKPDAEQTGSQEQQGTVEPVLPTAEADKNRPMPSDGTENGSNGVTPSESGGGTSGDIKDSGTQPSAGENPAAPDKPAEAAQAPSEEVAACIAKLYVLKSRFTGQLTALEKTITKAYENLPKEERVPASRKRIAGEYISTVSKLELECDAEVEAVLNELKDKLSQQGKDTSVVETLRQAYENEKSLKKAYYLDVYMNGI